MVEVDAPANPQVTDSESPNCGNARYAVEFLRGDNWVPFAWFLHEFAADSYVELEFIPGDDVRVVRL